MDLSFLPNWLVELASARARQRAVDMRIADGALPLVRLLSNLPDMPSPTMSGQELSGWPAWFLKALREAEPGLRALVKRRPSASPRVRETIGTARDELERAVVLLTGLFCEGFQHHSLGDDRRQGIEDKLRKALWHVLACRDALRSVTKA